MHAKNFLAFNFFGFAHKRPFRARQLPRTFHFWPAPRLVDMPYNNAGELASEVAQVR